MGVSPAALTFAAVQGQNPAVQTLEITKSANGQVTWTAADDAAWLTMTPTSGSAPTTVTVSVNVTGMAVGTHNATITLSAPDASNSPQSVAVTLTVTAALVFTSITTGDYHSCAITAAGAAWCWGRDEYGQLGDNSVATRRTSPVAVAGGLAFTAVAAGDFHTCGLTTNGAAYCWGLNDRGQLGDGTTTNRLAPTPVSGGLTFASISASGKAQLGSHTCALTTTGAAYCWGYNNAGQLGDGTTTQRTAPVPVAGALTFAAVTTGGFHSCGVTASNVAYCWGLNDSGQLGDGTQTQRTMPVSVAGGLSFTNVNGGGNYTCGVIAGGAGYCWGANFLYGQLGDGTTTMRTSPVAVTGGHTFGTVSAGGLHTCGLTSSGAAYCWGDNGRGELGDGTTTVRMSPGLVSGGLTFGQVSAGSAGAGGVGNGAHACGLTTNGAAYCWGRNDYGQLGDATIIDRSAPARVGQ